MTPACGTSRLPGAFGRPRYSKLTWLRLVTLGVVALSGCRTSLPASPPPNPAAVLPLTSDAEDLQRWLTERHPRDSDVASLESHLRAAGFSCHNIGDNVLWCDYQRAKQFGVDERWQVTVAHRDGKVWRIDVTFGYVGL
ncbi:MAG: hypothetical protein U0836_27340 [Pirellulales bacterium]